MALDAAAGGRADAAAGGRGGAWGAGGRGRCGAPRTAARGLARGTGAKGDPADDRGDNDEPE